jgi:hypothetical protein
MSAKNEHLNRNARWGAFSAPLTPTTMMLTVALSMLAVSHTSALLSTPVRTGAIATRTNAAIVMCSDEHHDVWLQRLVDAHAKAKRAELELTRRREEDQQSTSSPRASHRGPDPQMKSDDDDAKCSLAERQLRPESSTSRPLLRNGPGPAHRKAWEGRLHNLKNIDAIIDYLMAA